MGLQESLSSCEWRCQVVFNSKGRWLSSWGGRRPTRGPLLPRPLKISRDLCKNIAVRTSCFMDSRGRMPILTEKSPPAWCYKFFHQNAETFRHNVLSITVMDRFHIELVECLPDGNKWTSLCNHGCWYECLDPIPFWVWEILSLHAKSLRIINWIFRAVRVNQKAYQNLVNCYKDLLQE